MNGDLPKGEWCKSVCELFHPVVWYRSKEENQVVVSRGRPEERSENIQKYMYRKIWISFSVN